MKSNEKNSLMLLFLLRGSSSPAHKRQRMYRADGHWNKNGLYLPPSPGPWNLSSNQVHIASPPNLLALRLASEGRGCFSLLPSLVRQFPPTHSPVGPLPPINYGQLMDCRARCNWRQGGMDEGTGEVFSSFSPLLLHSTQLGASRNKRPAGCSMGNAPSQVLHQQGCWLGPSTNEQHHAGHSLQEDPSRALCQQQGLRGRGRRKKSSWPP